MAAVTGTLDSSAEEPLTPARALAQEGSSDEAAAAHLAMRACKAVYLLPGKIEEESPVIRRALKSSRAFQDAAAELLSRWGPVLLLGAPKNLKKG